VEKTKILKTQKTDFWVFIHFLINKYNIHQYSSEIFLSFFKEKMYADFDKKAPK
jgi:hypothetical protein